MVRPSGSILAQYSYALRISRVEAALHTDAERASLVQTVAMHRTLTINCEGRRFWASLLDPDGLQVADTVRVKAPYPLPPSAFLSVVGDLAARMPGASRATVGMPGAIRRGVVISTPHFVTARGPFTEVDPYIARQWERFDAQSAVRDALGIPTRVVNDAEIHGAAAIAGMGLEVVMTLGTGLGCAVFDEGRLLPHLELSRAPVHKRLTYDEWIGDRARRRMGNWRWSKRVREAVSGLRPMFLWDRLCIGGQNALKLTIELAPDIEIIPRESAVSGGARIWAVLDEAPPDSQ